MVFCGANIFSVWKSNSNFVNVQNSLPLNEVWSVPLPVYCPGVNRALMMQCPWSCPRGSSSLLGINPIAFINLLLMLIIDVLLPKVTMISLFLPNHSKTNLYKQIHYEEEGKNKLTITTTKQYKITRLHLKFVVSFTEMPSHKWTK